MTQVIVQYKVKADRTAENQRLVEAVYEELNATNPAGLRYVTFKKEDGVSFVHIAIITAETNPLTQSEAFKAFQHNIAERCEIPPHPINIEEVGAYGIPVNGVESTSRLMVEYKVKADRAAENQQLVEAVYEELNATNPAGLRYVTFKKEDGVSFVHIAATDTIDGHSPLPQSAAFQAFQHNIADRCEIPPHTVAIEQIGAYGFPVYAVE